MIRTKVWSSLLSHRNRFSKGFKDNLHHYHSDVVSPGSLRGIDYLADARLNKGSAFTLEERQTLGIHGLQPPRIRTQEEQIDLCKVALSRYKDSLNRYLYLNELRSRNERTYYRLISENVEEMLPIVYTPTVGLACQKFGLIYRIPRGLFITIHDKGHIYDVLKNWPEPNVRIVCVTDGERILGLGDLGASGMCIPVGKLSLCTALGGIDPALCLPIALDVGTNNQALMNDPTYVGLREKRTSGSLYLEFLDEFTEAISKKYGQNTVMQFEDFGNENAFSLLHRYRRKYCMFNDDIQGTGATVISGFMTAEKLTKKSMTDCNYLFFGAGQAAVGIAKCTVKALELKGLSYQEACDKIWMFDIGGLLTSCRPKKDLNNKEKFAKNVPHTTDLLETIDLVKPSFLIGASAAPGAFTPEVLQKMAEINERPVIFALSNPTCRSECTPELAYTCTEGRGIVATGSPFPPVEIEGNTFKPTQANNAYVFPGLALGITESRVHHVEDDMFLVAAETVCDYVTKEDLQEGSIYPPLKRIREISICIATRILQYSYDNNIATVYPEPPDKRAYIESKLYNYYYKPSLPKRWRFPDQMNVNCEQEVVAHRIRERGQSSN